MLSPCTRAARKRRNVRARAARQGGWDERSSQSASFRGNDEHKNRLRQGGRSYDYQRNFQNPVEVAEECVARTSQKQAHVSTERVRAYLRGVGIRSEGSDEEVLSRAKAFRRISSVPNADMLMSTLKNDALGGEEVEAMRDKHMRQLRKFMKDVRLEHRVTRSRHAGGVAASFDYDGMQAVMDGDLSLVLSDDEIDLAMTAKKHAIEEMITRVENEAERAREVENNRFDGAATLGSDATKYLLQHTAYNQGPIPPELIPRNILIHIPSNYAERYYQERRAVNKFLELKSKYLEEDERERKGTKQMRPEV